MPEWVIKLCGFHCLNTKNLKNYSLKQMLAEIDFFGFNDLPRKLSPLSLFLSSLSLAVSWPQSHQIRNWDMKSQNNWKCFFFLYLCFYIHEKSNARRNKESKTQILFNWTIFLKLNYFIITHFVSYNCDS